MPAPIVLFAFNRPDHLRRTLEALAANELAAESELTIFCDGPRNALEASQTDAAREVAHAASGFKSLAVFARDENRGLASSVISGVTRTVEQYGEVIVLEDDLLTSPWFLRYMNDALALYANHPKVASIHGYMFPHRIHPENDTFFLRGADCWGWATWKRAWSSFDPDAAGLLRRLRQRRQTFAFNRFWSYDYTGMLSDTANGKVNSWAVCWLASTWLDDMYTLYPSESLIFHAGSDGSGTHCRETDSLHDVPLARRAICVAPVTVREDAAMAGELRRFLRKMSGGIWFSRHAFLRDHPGLHTALRWLKRRLVPSGLKALLKDFLPPIVARALKKRMGEGIVWRGDYGNWQSAVAASGGYDQESVFIKVRDAARAVRDGMALRERDAVLFYHEEYNPPLLSALMTVAAWNGGRLRVLDFGGAFGSAYMQHKALLRKLDALSWNIVEQPHIVACGRQEFSAGALRFWPSMKACIAESPVDVILFSSVLQYMEEPYAILEQALDFAPQAIILDRTPFAEKGERITVQHVPAEIYPASYPCRWLDRRRVEDALKKTLITGPWWQSAVDPPGFQGIFGYAAKEQRDGFAADCPFEA